MKIVVLFIFIVCLNVNFPGISVAQSNYCKTGMASYYAHKFHGKITASGEKYDMYELTAAHNTLPFNSFVKVTNLQNNKSVVVKINDRGPHVKSRIIDISKAAAEKIDLIQSGVAKVRVEAIIDPSKENNTPQIQSDEPVSVKESNVFKPGNIYASSGNEVRLKGYVIQLGSYAELEKAEKQVEKLRREIKNIYIEVAVVNKKTTYRILTGDFQNKTSAQKELTKLKKSGYKGFIKSIK